MFKFILRWTMNIIAIVFIGFTGLAMLGAYAPEKKAEQVTIEKSITKKQPVKVSKVNLQTSQKQFIKNEMVKSYSLCVLKLGFAINTFYEKGLTPTKVVDSATDKITVYKVSKENKTGFYTCDDNHYKVWVETF